MSVFSSSRQSILQSLASENGSTPQEILAAIAYVTADAGETNDDGNTDACLEVYLDDATTLATDLSFYRNAASTNPDAILFAIKPTTIETTAEVISSRIIPQPAAPSTPTIEEAIAASRSASKSTHESAVAEIVGLIRAKYEDEGIRNFAIGKRTYEHARWQRDDFGDKYESGDVDNLMNRIRDDVRIEVAISPKAIKVGEWMRCHILRMLVGAEIGEDRAARLSFFEYRSLYGSALAFDKKNVEGSLVVGWMTLVREIVSARESGQRISSETFLAMVDKTTKQIAASKVSADPVAAAAKMASDALKAKNAAKAKATKDITESMSDGLSTGNVTPEQVAGLFESVLNHHGINMPSSMGFDPAKATKTDCDQIAGGMYAAGKFAEMIYLRDKLNAMVSKVERAAAAAKANATPKLAIA